MKINCEQTELSRFLQIVARAISTKSTLPILTGVLLEAKNNYLRCVATDLEISIEVKVPNVQIYEEGALVVPGKTFVEIIRHLPTGIVEIHNDGNTNMTSISSNHSSFQLPILPIEEFPMLPELKEGNKFDINGGLLKEAIRQTIYATLAEDPRPFLSSILWEISPDKLRLVATDVNRLAIRDIPINSQVQGNALLPVRALREMANIFGNNSDDSLEISLLDRVIFLTGSGVTFSSRLIEAQFPRYEQVIPREFNGSLIIGRNALIDALERSALVSNSIKMKVNTEDISITAKEPDKGHSFEEINADISGVSLEIGFNVRFLLDFLKSIDSEKIIFKYIQEQKPALLQGENRTDYQYIVMPLKLSV